VANATIHAYRGGNAITAEVVAMLIEVLGPAEDDHPLRERPHPNSRISSPTEGSSVCSAAWIVAAAEARRTRAGT
jgi:hypothetical protein